MENQLVKTTKTYNQEQFKQYVSEFNNQPNKAVSTASEKDIEALKDLTKLMKEDFGKYMELKYGK